MTGNVHVTGRRIVATIIDATVLGIVSSFFNAGRLASGFSLTRLAHRESLLLLLTVVLYYVLLEGLAGATLGKLVTGIRVVTAATGRPPGLGRAFVRTVLRLVDGAFGYLVGFLVVLASRHRRRLGDMVAGTLVIRA